MLGRGGEFYQLPRGGGLEDKYRYNSDEEEEDAGGGGVVQMEVESEDDGDDQRMHEIDPEDTVTYPMPEPWIVVGSDHATATSPPASTFYFDTKRIPSTVRLQTVRPQLMKALSSLTDLGSIDIASTGFHPLMPMPVHGSPLISLFENAASASARGGPTRKEDDTLFKGVLKERYTSHLYSCYQLQQMKRMCLEGQIAFHPSFSPALLERADHVFKQRIATIDQMQNRSLDALFQIYASGATNRELLMHEFCKVLVAHSFRYLHVHEEFLWICLVAPYAASFPGGIGIPLSAVLTPTDEVPLSACPADVQTRLVKDMCTFFKHKVDARTRQEQDNAAKGIASTDAAPLVPLQAETIPAKVASPTEIKYNGYMPVSTLWEYFCFLDVDGKTHQ